MKYAVTVFLFLLISGFSKNLLANDSFDASYLGNYPDEFDCWGNEVQGVAHDEDYWYVTRRDAILRISETTDLGSCKDVQRRDISDIPELDGYNHFSDFDHFKYNGEGFLVIPVEGDGKPNVVAIFRPNASLDYIGKVEVGSGRWLAVSPSGHVYFPEGGSALTKYSLDWEKLQNQGEVSFQYLTTISLKDESGGPLNMAHPQGGAFSPQGNLIYLSDGYFNDGGTGGIHVVDFQSGEGIRIAKSKNNDDIGGFNYAYDSSCGIICEEPEGLTWWNQDQGQAPKIDGQLHAILLDNDLLGDDVYFKHYRLQEPGIHNLVLHNEIIQGGLALLYGATDSITAGSNYTIEAGAEVIFHAGEEIRLQKGFHAQRGSHFQAKIK